MKQIIQKSGPMVLVVLLGLIVMLETGLLINDYMYFQAIGEEMPVVQVFRKAKPTIAPVANNEGTIEQARAALTTYFTLLSEKNYSEAVKYHGSGYDFLLGLNPIKDKTNLADILRQACNKQVQCLKIRRIVSEKIISKTYFSFTVEFSNPDGTLYEYPPVYQGPDQAPIPAKTQFDFAVEFQGGRYLVMTQLLYHP